MACAQVTFIMKLTTTKTVFTLKCIKSWNDIGPELTKKGTIFKTRPLIFTVALVTLKLLITFYQIYKCKSMKEDLSWTLAPTLSANNLYFYMTAVKVKCLLSGYN